MSYEKGFERILWKIIRKISFIVQFFLFIGIMKSGYMEDFTGKLQTEGSLMVLAAIAVLEMFIIVNLIVKGLVKNAKKEKYKKNNKTNNQNYYKHDPRRDYYNRNTR